MPSITEIEDAVAARLRGKGLQVSDNFVRKGLEDIMKPSVHVAVEEGRFEKVSQSTFRQKLSIYVYVVFKQLQGDKERRRGIYPIIEAVIGILLLQVLGLKITPLQPVSFKNATDEEFASAGLIAFQLVFETGCFIERMNDEQTTALLKMGLDYYLKPGDGVNDGQDVVVLPPLP